MRGSILSIDFETRSTLDLKQVGLPRYSTHPTTDIWCLAFGWSDSLTKEVFTWTPLGEKPAVMCDWVRDGGLVSAWNAGFELAIWNEILAPRYGFPPLSPKQCVDTMFLAQARGLPGGLDDCAKALRLNIRKDAEGSRLMTRMCKPRKVQPDGTVIWWDDAERVSRLIEYCRQDVRVEQDILRRLPPVIPSEQRHWELTHEINQRGVYLDRALIDGAQTVLVEQVKTLNHELRELTQGQVQSATAVSQLRAFVSEALDMPLETLDKTDVSRLLALGDDLTPVVKRILEIRQEIGKSSTGKLKAMLNRMSPDSRIRGLFRMHGAASTGRYTSVALQLQNLPRKAVKPPRVLDLIITGDRDGVELFSADTVMSTISAAIRPMIAAPPGKVLLDADYSQIESRFTAWLADDQDKLEVFRQNRDVYKMVGSGMFGIPEDEVVGDLRQSAKTAELACGFGGGVGALFAMAEAYGLNLTEDEAQDTVTRWREANPKTKALWYTLKDAAFAAMKTPNTWFGAQDNRVGYCFKGNSLRCQLPSGRQIVYPWAELIQVPAPWDETKLIDAIQYEGFSAKQGNKWVKRIAWHGILVENIVQGACADILRHALELLETDGQFYTVAHIHDEIICEVPEADGPRLLTRMIDLMSRTPTWAEGLPLNAEGKYCKRFTK